MLGLNNFVMFFFYSCVVDRHGSQHFKHRCIRNMGCAFPLWTNRYTRLDSIPVLRYRMLVHVSGIFGLYYMFFVKLVSR